MEDLIPSIPLAEIDRGKCYFNPGCALSVYKPHAEGQLLELLNRQLGPVKPHNICCQHEPRLPAGSVIINNCAGCDRRFRSLYPGISTVSLWEVLDSISGLPLPQYPGLTVSVHDSCSFRPKPQVHAAVRSLLGKMGIGIVESEFSGTRSVCCGDSFYPRLSIPEVNALQRARAEQMPCQDVVVYCVSCIKSMTIGGKTAHHMADLVLGEETESQDLNLETYHCALQQYIDRH